MSGRPETTALFTLNQIMRAHEDQLREAEEASARREVEERDAREANARREAEVQAAQKREAESREAREAEAQRAEAVRLEALRLAAIERARIEAETRARIEIMQRSAEHEQKIAALRADAEKKRLERTVVTAVIGAVAMFGIGAGVFYGKLKPESEARIAESSTRVAMIEEETSKLKARIEENARRVKQAEEDLRAAQALHHVSQIGNVM